MMNNQKAFTATIELFILGDKEYYRYVDCATGESSLVPAWCLDNFYDFPQQMKDGEHIRNGAQINLIRDEEKNRVYADYRFYVRRRRQQPEAGEPKATVSERIVAALTKGSESEDASVSAALIDEAVPYAPVKNVAQLMGQLFGGHFNDFTAEQLCQVICDAKEEPESVTRAKVCNLLGKANVTLTDDFTTSSTPNIYDEQGRIDLRLLRLLSSIVNNRAGGDLIVGAQGGNVCGINAELDAHTESSSFAELADGLKNIIGKAIDCPELADGLEMSLLKTSDSKLFVHIRIPAWNGEPVFVGGTELWVRSDDGEPRQLFGKEMAKFICQRNRA